MNKLCNRLSEIIHGFYNESKDYIYLIMFINEGPLHAKLFRISVGVSDAYYHTSMLDTLF